MASDTAVSPAPYSMFQRSVMGAPFGRLMAALAVLVLISACAGPAGPRPAGQEFSQQGQRPGGATRVAGPVNNPQAQSQPAPDSVFGATTDPQTRPRTRPVKVGLLLPLTGRGSDVGQALFNAAQLAMFELADDNFVLIPRDTKGTPEGAQLAIQSLLAENVELVLGPLFSGSVGAVKPFAEDAGVNLIGFTTDWRLASQANRGRLGLEGGSGAYVMGILPFSQVDRVIAYAAAQGLQRLGILAPETLYADAVVTGALESAARYQVDVTKVSRYPDDVEDLRPVVQSFTDFEQREAALEQVKAELEKRTDTASRQALRQLQNADTYGDAPFDAALIVEGGARMSIIGPLLPFYDVDPRIVQLMGTGLWDDTALLREPTLEGAWFASPAVSQREAFETSYRQNFGSRPPRIATIAYDALALAAVLARRDVDFFSDEKEIRDAAWTSRIYRSDVLTNPNGFAGTDGIFRFSPNGLVERGLAIIEIGPEGFTVLDEAPDTFVEPAF